MDKDTVVTEQTESGRRLISALAEVGFDVRVAFWAKPTDEGKWFLYLASTLVDDKGPAAAYRIVHDILRKMPDLWIDPFEIRVVGLNDSLTEAALAATRPKECAGNNFPVFPKYVIKPSARSQTGRRAAWTPMHRKSNGR